MKEKLNVWVRKHYGTMKLHDVQLYGAVVELEDRLAQAEHERDDYKRSAVNQASECSWVKTERDVAVQERDAAEESARHVRAERDAALAEAHAERVANDMAQAKAEEWYQAAKLKTDEYCDLRARIEALADEWAQAYSHNLISQRLRALILQPRKAETALDVLTRAESLVPRDYTELANHMAKLRTLLQAASPSP